MRFVSPLLRSVIYPGLFKGGYLRSGAHKGPTVLTYHGVLPSGYKLIDPVLDGNLVDADSFREQLRFLKKHCSVISPKEFSLWCKCKHDLSPRSVLLTCDDGLRNSLFDMLPILQEFECECLFFVTGGSLAHTPTMLWYEELYLMLLAAPRGYSGELLGTGLQTKIGRREKHSLWWELVKKLSQFDPTRRKMQLGEIRMHLGLSEQWDTEYRDDPVLARRFLLLNLTELDQLAEARMCVGAHSISHPMLSQSTPDDAWTEISESKRRLEEALGREVWAMAYPFGDSSSVTSRETQLAKRAGFKAAFLNTAGGLGARTPRFALPRVHVSGGMTLAEFEAHISGLHRSLQELFRPPSLTVGFGA